MSEATSHKKSFNFWKEHNSECRTNTELVTHEFLHEAHPEHHITRVNPEGCDLLGYAAAGYATATPENDIGYDATRTYRAPGPRLEKKPGKLEDDVKFGRWSYTWQKNDYILYEIGYQQPILLRPVTWLFVLSPHSHEAIKNGNHAATDDLLLAVGEWTKELHEEIEVFDDAHWRKDKELWKSVQNASWDEVILDPTMKANLIQDVQSFFDNQELYKSLKVPWKRGVILHGVPGNGKTLSIKALINSLAARAEPIPSLYVKSLDACNGPKWSIQSIFSHARIMAPCLLIFEDLDSLVGEETRSYFLNEVDGLESNDGILIIGSTNHLGRLDPSITKRPSRFDRKYHFKVPNEQERVAYCRYWSCKFTNSSTADFPDDLCHFVAAITEGFSFAYLKELFIASLLTLARGAQEEPEGADAAQEAAPPSDGSSMTDGVVVERPAAAIEGEDSAEKTESAKEDAEAEKAEPKKPRRTLPEVEVPENLRDNVLLRIVRTQARTLLEEMDNTEEDALASVPHNPSLLPSRRALQRSQMAGLA
jgi:transitional endoplasmic reticulum ATPase